MISLRVDSATQVEMTATHPHADIGSVDSSSIWQDMRQRTLCSELTITLISLSVSCRSHGARIFNGTAQEAMKKKKK